MRPRPRTAASGELPEPCRRCTYWELIDGRRGTDTPSEEASPAEACSARAAKDDWWDAAALQWQPVGLVVGGAGQECEGYALLGPPHRFPRSGRLGGVSSDAWLLAMLWTRDGDRRVADALTRAALSSAVTAGTRALEAFATRRPAEPCHAPRDLLEGAGFAIHRDHLVHPLMRLDVRQTPGLRDRAAEALRGLRGVVPSRREAPSLPAAGN